VRADEAIPSSGRQSQGDASQQQPHLAPAAALTASQRATVAAAQSAELSSISAFFGKENDELIHLIKPRLCRKLGEPHKQVGAGLENVC